MGSHLTRNKRSNHIRNHNRRLHTATNFFKFSPTFLRLRLMPRWAFVSLAANGFLLAVLLGLVLKDFSMPMASSAPVRSPSPEATEVQASLTTIASSEPALGPRHQLTYQEWKDLLAQEARAAVEQQPERLTVLAGDSISLWFPDALLPNNRDWLNQAISGETSAGLLKRLDLFDQTLPETILVMIGINDLLRGTSEQTILANVQQILESLQATHPQAQIVLQSVLPHAAEKSTWEGRDRLLELPNSRIRTLNDQLEALAQQEGVYFLDLYPLFANAQGNLKMTLSTDGLHLSSEGYQVWGIALQVYSREVLEPDLDN
ncbi:MAG: hypothetical protein Kow00121_59310 [Elainellaceae cyanobacterium]